MARKLTAIAIATLVPNAGVVQAQDAEVATTFDEEWITLNGEVQSVLPRGFVLDYGDDDITVEMDRFDWTGDKTILVGDEVRVMGRMDRGFRERRSIEAATVFVPRLSEFLYADPEDEEGDPSFVRGFAPGLFAGPEEGDWLSFTGRVVGVDGDEITVASPANEYRVDTSAMPGDIDPTGLEVGDRVLVTGEMDAADLFDEREIEADSVILLSAHRR